MAANSVLTLQQLGGRQHQMNVLGRAHAMAADKYENYHTLLGIPVVVLTTVVGSAVFASVTDLGKTQTWIAIAVGSMSVLAAVLAALQTFLNFGNRAQKHSQAAAQLNGLARRMDVLWRLRDADKINSEMAAVDSELTQIIQSTPRVSLALQQTAKALIDDEKMLFSQISLSEDDDDDPLPKPRTGYVFSSPPPG